MQFYEFGQDNEEKVILIHPSLVMWDFFEYVIEPLSKNYHLIIPALPGYDKETQEDFTSVEDIANRIEDWCLRAGYESISGIYGCSMGGAVVIKLLSNNKIKFGHAIIDGGITPYQLPWILTRLIAIKDFLLITIGKIGGLKLLEKAFATDEFSKEDLLYMADVLSFISYRTIWRTFDSCNNYQMPVKIRTDCKSIAYWYGSKEKKERKSDIRYIEKHFDPIKFEEFKDMGHASIPLYRPELFVNKLNKLLR